MGLYLRFSPDGKWLATLSHDAVYLWEPITGQLAGRLFRSKGGERELTFSPDGKQLAVEDADRVRLWRLPAAPASLAEMRRRTWLALDAARTPGGGVEILPWQRWHALRQSPRRSE